MRHSGARTLMALLSPHAFSLLSFLFPQAVPVTGLSKARAALLVHDLGKGTVRAVEPLWARRMRHGACVPFRFWHETGR